MSHAERRPDAAPHAGIEHDDRRRHPRRASTAAIRLRIEAREFDGQAENVSTGGMLFFTEGELTLTVEIEDANGAVTGAAPIRRTARLVRAQRLGGDQIGWAVEFDPS